MLSKSTTSTKPATKPTKPVSVHTPTATSPAPAAAQLPATQAPLAAPPAPTATPAATTKPADALLHKSSVQSPVKAVWELCEKMVGAKRSEVVKAAIAQGIAPHTAKTQYQRWFTARKAKTASATPASSAASVK